MDALPVSLAEFVRYGCMVVIGVGVSDGIGDGAGCAAARSDPAPRMTTAVRTMPANQRFICTSIYRLLEVCTTERVLPHTSHAFLSKCRVYLT
jgi:hypothetical protein